MGLWPSANGNHNTTTSNNADETQNMNSTLNASKSNFNPTPSTVIEKEKRVLEKIQKRQVIFFIIIN